MWLNMMAMAVHVFNLMMNNASTIGDLRPKWGIISERECFRAYLGIRYALPPTGEDRFEAPRPIDKFDRFVEPTFPCVQIHPLNGKAFGVEDCLNLNVFVPGERVTDKLPVMIWLYGTPFTYGRNSVGVYNPIRFLEQGIIVVNLNYRVGILGFGCLDTNELQCNLGLKDQEAAINWVLENIEKFGGDPGNITLAGHGAGAAHALFHLHGPFKGIIGKGIALSGSRFAPWALPDREKNIELTKTAIAECLDDDVAACLKNSSVVDIAINSWTAMIESGNWNLFWPFGPVVDGQYISSYPSLKDSTGNFSLLVGLSLEQTGKSMTALFNRRAGNDQFGVYKHIVESKTLGSMDDNERRVYEKRLRMYYDEADLLSRTAVNGWFYHPSMLEFVHHAGPVQGFMFDHRDHPVCGNTSETLNRDELAYLFNIPGCNYTEEDLKISRKYVKALVDFVKTGRAGLKKYSEDKELFDISSAPSTPVLSPSYLFVLQSLNPVWGLMKMLNLIKQSLT